MQITLPVFFSISNISSSFRKAMPVANLAPLVTSSKSKEVSLLSISEILSVASLLFRQVSVRNILRVPVIESKNKRKLIINIGILSEY
jgi:hypothetical protein